MSELLFYDFCKILNNVQCEIQHQKKIQIIKNFIAENTSDNLFEFYPVLRLLLPKLDKERGAYGLQERKLAEIIARTLNLQKNTSDYRLLFNYSQHLQKNLKNFVDVACSLLRRRFLKSGNLKIKDINDYLNNISKFQNNIREKEQEIVNLFNKTNNEEQKWILRILLKELKLGISGEKILSLYHNDAVRLFYYRSSLLKVCNILHSSQIHLDDIQIELFSPCHPMLAERCDIKVINTIISNNDEFLLEKKFDGERFQIHMKDGKFSYFSRRGINFTHTFGENYDEGLYTPKLRDTFKDSVKSFIFDGEMMGFNKETDEFGSKGMHFDVKNLSEDSKHQPCFIAFDILLLNDEVLTKRPISERVQLLSSLIVSVRGIIMVSTVDRFKTKQELLDQLNKAVDNEEEGIVFKKPNSMYKPNSRKEGWWKLKLEYFENVMSDMDLIIMGGYYGVGNYAKKVVGFLVGVAEKTNEDSFPNAYLSFCKVQSGLNNDELDYIHTKIGRYWKSSDNPGICDLKFGKEKPDLWISPGNSLLVVVRGTELIKLSNKDYETPYTIRFPRIIKINDTKPHYECFSLNELLNYTKSNHPVIKLSKRHLTMTDLIVHKKIKKTKQIILPIQYENVERISSIFKGYEFCVWTGNDKYSKVDIEKLIAENGGSITQFERVETFCILIGNYTIQLDRSDIIKDVVKLNWLFRIIDNGDFEMYDNNDLLCCTPESKLRLIAEYDQHGDSYTKFSTRETLREIVLKIKSDCIVPSDMEIVDLKKEMSNINC